MFSRIPSLPPDTCNWDEIEAKKRMVLSWIVDFTIVGVSSQIRGHIYMVCCETSWAKGISALMSRLSQNFATDNLGISHDGSEAETLKMIEMIQKSEYKTIARDT